VGTQEDYASCAKVLSAGLTNSFDNFHSADPKTLQRHIQSLSQKWEPVDQRFIPEGSGQLATGIAKGFRVNDVQHPKSDEHAFSLIFL
jgi:hypothetical protein